MEQSVTLHDKTFKPFIPNAEIEAAIDRVAERLNRDYAGGQDTPLLICVLTGAILFTAELMKRLTFTAELACTKLSSYAGTESTGFIREDLPVSAQVEGRRILILEDIVDTGTTVTALMAKLQQQGASDVRICTLLYKPESYTGSLPIDYVALDIPSRFIVGFGLDYDQLGRNLPDIYVLDTQTA